MSVEAPPTDSKRQKQDTASLPVIVVPLRARGRIRIRELLAVVVPPVLVMIVVLLVLERALRSVPIYLAPRPSAVFNALLSTRSELLGSLWWTTVSAVTGFVASAVIGVGLAIVLASSPWVRRAFYPYTIFFQTVPIVAIAPLLVFWLNAGLVSVTASAFIVSVFPVIANTLAGLLSTDPAMLDLFRLYGATPVDRLWKLRLPWSIPNIITGLRVAGGLAVIGTVVSEFLVGQLGDRAGLGVQVVSGIKYGRTDIVFAAVLLASALGLFFFGLVNLIGWLLLKRWHASARG